MKCQLLYLSLLTTLMFVSCQTFDSSNLSVDSSLSDKFSGQLIKDQTLYVWGDYTDQPDYIKSWMLISNGDGSFHSSTKQRLPPTPGSLTLYALHGNFTPPPVEDTDPFPSENGLTHQVKTDQQDRSPQNRAQSDLLYGIKSVDEPFRQAVPLSLYHMLSQVGVVLRAAGDGLKDEDMQKATVDILNTRIQAQFKPLKTDEAGLQDPTVRSGMITPGGDPQTIRLSTCYVPKGTPFDNPTYGQAIIVPQTLSALPFIRVTLANGAVRKYTLPATTTFSSGTYYAYNITVSDTLAVECNVFPEWANDGSNDVSSLSFDGADVDDWTDDQSIDVNSTTTQSLPPSHKRRPVSVPSFRHTSTH